MELLITRVVGGISTLLMGWFVIYLNPFNTCYISIILIYYQSDRNITPDEVIPSCVIRDGRHNSVFSPFHFYSGVSPYQKD